MKRLLLKLSFERWYLLVGILFSSAMVVVSTVYIPVFLGECYQVIESGVWSFRPLILLAVGYVLRAVFKLVRNHFAATLGHGLVEQLRKELCAAFLDESGRAADSGSYAYSVLSYEIESISNLVSWRPCILLENISILIWSFVRLGSTNTVLLAAVVPFLLISLLAGGIYGKSIRGAMLGVKKTVHQLSDLVEETMTNQKLIRAMNAQPTYEGKFDAANTENRKWNLLLGRKTQFATPAMALISYLSMAAAVVISGVMVITQGLPGAMVVTLYSYMVTLSELATKLPDNIYAFVESGQSIRRAEEYFLSIEHTEQDRTEKPASESLDTITYENVTAYTGKTALWHLPDLRLSKGELVVVTGGSGRGKTLFCDTLAGFATGYTGDIRVNGTDLREIDLNWYRNRVGYALQKTMIFTDTVMGNVQMDRSAPEDEAQILSVCKLNSVIAKYADAEIKGDTNVLSGGERQRVGMARALYGSPELLIFDDNFTALDADLRKEIITALSKWKKDRITVVVSSYPEVLEQADWVIDLDGREVAGNG